VNRLARAAAPIAVGRVGLITADTMTLALKPAR
jgi:hypothetical protein